VIRQVRTITTGSQAQGFGSREFGHASNHAQFGQLSRNPGDPQVRLMFEAGVCAGVASGSYEFASTTTVTGPGTLDQRGEGFRDQRPAGAYLGLGGTYQINDAWSLQLAGRYQYMDEFELGVNGSNAVLSFDSAFVLSIGALYSF
jgi:hypothetical protein